jgi:glycosyltransferase involved in cell wall biosynthesis
MGTAPWVQFAAWHQTKANLSIKVFKDILRVKSMYRILHTEWSKGWGGQEVRIIQESLAFLKRGYGMMIACQPGSGIQKAARDKGIPVISLRMRAAIDPLAILGCARAIQKNSIDLVHTHSSVDSWCCSIASQLSGIPVVRSRHLGIPVRTNSFSYFLYMKLADRIITSGEAVRKRMIEVNGYDPRKIVSIPAGIDEQKFSLEINGDPVRKEFNLQPGDFLLGVVSMLRKWKGHLYLLEAVKALEERIPHLKLLIAGSGPQEETIKGFIRENGLAGKVIMAGYREDVPRILKSLDLFVFPSYTHEAAPQGILQAMAMGIPVVSTFVGGIEDVVTNGQTGILVPPADARALSEAILRVYQNRGESEEMARRAKEMVWKNYSFSRTIERTEEVYKSLLEKGPRERVLT